MIRLRRRVIGRLFRDQFLDGFAIFTPEVHVVNYSFDLVSSVHSVLFDHEIPISVALEFGMGLSSWSISFDFSDCSVKRQPFFRSDGVTAVWHSHRHTCSIQRVGRSPGENRSCRRPANIPPAVREAPSLGTGRMSLAGCGRCMPSLYLSNPRFILCINLLFYRSNESANFIVV